MAKLQTQAKKSKTAQAKQSELNSSLHQKLHESQEQVRTLEGQLESMKQREEEEKHSLSSLQAELDRNKIFLKEAEELLQDLTSRHVLTTKQLHSKTTQSEEQEQRLQQNEQEMREVVKTLKQFHKEKE